MKKKLPKKILEEILNVLSPNKIAKLLGVHRSTIMTFAKEYRVYFLHAGHYIRIDRFNRYQGRKSDFYEPYHRWVDYLKKIGKFNDR